MQDDMQVVADVHKTDELMMFELLHPPFSELNEARILRIEHLA